MAKAKSEKVNDVRAGDGMRLRIQNEVMRQYATKNLEDITIKEICSNLSIARTSFYYYYGNVRDVLDEIENGILTGFFGVSYNYYQHYENNDGEFMPIIKNTIDYLFSYRPVLKTLLFDRPDSVFADKWTKLMMERMSRVSDNKLKLMLCSSTWLTFFKYYIANNVPREKIHPEVMVKYAHDILTNDDLLLHDV